MMTLDVFLPALTAIAAVLMANQLGNLTFYRQKTWDLRRSVYGSILAELDTMNRVFKNGDEYIEQGANRYFNEPVSNEHREEISSCMGRIKKSHSDNYLILSEMFEELYAQFETDWSYPDPNNQPDEDYDHFSKALEKHRPRLKAQARKEMLDYEKSWLSFL